MNSMRNRMVILVLAITVILGLLACSTTGGPLSRNDPTATPTKTPKPTFTITPTPTDTPIPTNTPTPTNTATPTPENTNTPIVLTATPTLTPTNTVAPTATKAPPTATRRPATRVPPTATKAPPPNTPAPRFAWSGVVSNQLQNCGLTRVFGFTLAANGALAGDQWVHYWADGWNGDWAKSSWTDFGAGTSWKGDEGNWDGTIDTRARDGVWHVCVTDNDDSWTCISNTVDVKSSSDCAAGYQVFHITFRKN